MLKHPQSIRRELPLLISALLVAVVGAVSWSAYDTVQEALLAAEAEHLQTAARHLATTLETSGLRLRIEGQRASSDPGVARFLLRRDPASRASVLHALEQQREARAQTLAVTLWDADRRPLVFSGDLRDSAEAVARARPSLASDAGANGGTVVRFAAAGDSAFVILVAPVLRGAGDTLGFVTEYRRLSGGGQVELMRGLIGSHSRFAIGNPEGDVWTNLAGRVDGPPGVVRPDDALEYRRSDGAEWLAGAVIVPSTSWRVLVETPRRAVLAPARSVLLQILAIALIVVVAGALGAWFLSRRITAPLADVSLAAEGIAAGDYTRRASVVGEDEIGRLATSFNSMATRVEESTRVRQAQAAELAAKNHELSVAVAEKERARREAEASATELRALVSVVTDIVVHFDRDGRYVKILETGTHALARPAAEMLGRTVHDILSAESAASIVATIRTALAEGRRVDVEYSLELDGRGLRWFAGAASPMPDGNVLWVARDVTERHRLEEQLRQAQKMEAVGQLAGGIAHDFNNMLTAIRSFSELLLADTPAGSPHRDDLLEIQRAADRAASLTRQLLAFSRRQLLQPVALDLNHIVTGMEEMLRRLLVEDIDLVCRLDPALDAAVADPGQIEQIVMNLAVNARDAMPNGGRLTIETSNTEVDEEYAARAGDIPPGHYVVLAVSDTGVGMDAATQAKIFEPFFTTKEPGKGTGLGLSTVFGIVKQSLGHVTVYSEVGRGTTFRIYLPRAESAARSVERAKAAELASAKGHETILLVEDDPAVRLVAARILSRQGYRVLEAATPAAAEAIVARRPGVIDLVMTDLVLPEMSGRELADRLQSVEPRLRVLYMSGYTDDAVIRRGLLEPGMAFLSKPFSLEELARTVRTTLDNGHVARRG